MSFDGAALIGLLPALYRLRDAAIAQSQNNPSGPLQSLLGVISEQFAVLEADLDQLYDNLFIETCAQWVIPYIGDLIGYQPVNGVAPSVASPRAEVAHTISFRQRKGTVLVLEQLARDVTGWGAHAVEFFKLLPTTQYMNHVRPDNCYSPDLRGWRPREFMDTGFDATPHTVDVRRIAVERGRYNIQNIGIFLWPLFPYSLTLSPAAEVTGHPLCYRFNPLGCDMRLFVQPVAQGIGITAPAPATPGSEITAPAGPENVPDRLSRHMLCHDLHQVQAGAASVYYGAGLSLALYLDGPNGAVLPPQDIQVCNLSGADGSWANLPPASSTFAACVDPELGRIALPAAAKTPPLVLFTYGFSGDMGGGPYARAAGFSSQQPVVRVPGDFATVQAALDALAGNGVVEITDNRAHEQPAGLTVMVTAGGHIELRAQDGSRPVLVLGAEMTVTGGAAAGFDMNGLVVTSTFAPPADATLVRVPVSDGAGNTNMLSQFGIVHCTLVPGWALAAQTGAPVHAGAPGLIAASAGLKVTIQRSILGGMLTQPFVTVNVCDSVIDANGQTNVAYAAPDGLSGGGALTLTGCTVIGKVHATALSLVSNSIFWAGLAASNEKWTAPLRADRKQEGCVRFSYLPTGAVTPRTFACVTEREGTPNPLFASLRYGDPGYGRLLAVTDDMIRRGANDGGEMGAFHFVQAPQRETDLRVRLNEYMPVGLEYGLFYQS